MEPRSGVPARPTARVCTDAHLDDADVAGDPACWAHLICPLCGLLADAPGTDGCARCEADAAHWVS